MSEKREMKIHGQVTKAIKNSAGGVFGLELGDGVSYYLSRQSSIDLKQMEPGSYVEITYGEFNNRRYINAITMTQSPGQELADEPLDGPDDPALASYNDVGAPTVAPEPEPTSVDPETKREGGNVTNLFQDTGTPVPVEKQPETAVKVTEAPVNAGKTKPSVSELTMKDRRALLSTMEYIEKKELIDLEKEKTSEYWEGKTAYDREVFELNKEKFSFEKQRAAEISEQVKQKIRAEMIPIAFEIFNNTRKGNDSKQMSVIEQLSQVLKIAKQLANATDKGFSAVIEELRVAQEKMSQPQQGQGFYQRGNAASAGPGR